MTVLDWSITVVLAVAIVGFGGHLVAVFQKPLERPRVRRRNRWGEPLGERTNPGAEVAPGRDPSSAEGP